MENKDIKIKEAEHVIVIDLPDKSFSVFADALKLLPEKHKDKKILMVQSIEKENEPFRIVIVFHF